MNKTKERSNSGIQKHADEKSNKKIYIIFAAFLVFLYAAGYVVGRLAAKAEKAVSFENLLALGTDFAVQALPIVFLVVSVVGIVFPVIVFLSCYSLYKRLQKERENDDLWDILEEKLNGPMICSNLFAMIELCLFFCCMYEFLVTDYGKNGGSQAVLRFGGVVLFLIAAVVDILIPKLTLDIEKKLNPEKRGNIFDLQFQKVWMNSCDEAQRLTIYQAGYKAYRNTNIACYLLCIVAFSCALLFQTDILALILVWVIWFINNMSYMLRVAKLEKRKSAM